MIFSFVQERIVVENSDWLCVVPYWAMWPYETMLLPKRHILRLQDLTDSERQCELTVWWLILHYLPTAGSYDNHY